MPELPEVQVVVNALNAILPNQIIQDVLVYKDKIIKGVPVQEFISELQGRQIRQLERHGKAIIFRFTDDLVLLSHLRMEGKYFWYEGFQEPIEHHHVCFRFMNGKQLDFADTRIFGTFHLRTNQNYLTTNPLNKIAQEPKDIDFRALYKRTSKSTSAIKTVLLKQEVVAGIGNIYADEILFAAQVHPATPAKMVSLPEIQAIIQHATAIFAKAIAMGGTSINSYTSVNGQPGRYQSELKVHLRDKQPCVVCNTTITKIKLNGRGTYFCSACQPEK